VEPVHRRLAEIGLQVAAQYGFALAGGYAVQAHGVASAYTQHRYTVEITQRFETFARLMVAEPTDSGHSYKVELAANWRAQPPVQMDIGPVLHADDVVAGKMSALYTRAEPRDFLDVDAAITSGRYSRQRLCELAEQADAGFDRRILADLFAMLARYPDRRFAFYGADPDHLIELRARFADWRQALLNDDPSASG
jgi:hypothetical protein